MMWMLPDFPVSLLSTGPREAPPVPWQPSTLFNTRCETWETTRHYVSTLAFFFFSSRRRHTRSDRDWSSECALPILTYNLHIILRFELEQELIEGRVAVADLPEAWNARVEQYLGLEVPDDARGVLQEDRKSVV